MLKHFHLVIIFILMRSILIGANNQINAFSHNEISYFSIAEFCDSQDYKYIYYEDKAKVAILFNDFKMTFSSNSSFVQIDNKTVHLLNNMIIKDDVFYLPANSFNILSKYYSTPTVMYNQQKKNFSVLPFTKEKLAGNNQNKTHLYTIFILTNN